MGTILDLALVVLGFGLIIVVHELGHFLAARWAGIRVLAFAVGFGPPILAYRKGLGWSRSSTEGAYAEAIRAGRRDVSPTEYRLNVLPLGGYVRMLGQEDLDPSAVSGAPDSYQRCVPWKRMVVISAGVVFNVLLAGVLFIAVFMLGLKTEPAVVGAVEPGSPAAAAVTTEGVESPMRAGDRILAIDGSPVRSFGDVVVGAAMAESGEPVVVRYERGGVPGEVVVFPEVGSISRLLEFGIGPARGTMIAEPTDEASRTALASVLARAGLEGVGPGWVLESIDGVPASTGDDLAQVITQGDGRPVSVVFRSPGGERLTRTITPEPSLEVAMVEVGRGRVAGVEHVLGLVPVMTVEQAGPRAAEQGLRAGDVFARIGDREFPSLDAGIGVIRSAAGSTVPVTVLRRSAVMGEGAAGGAGEEWAAVELPAVSVSREGTIGFTPGDTSAMNAMISAVPMTLREAHAFVPNRLRGESEERRPSAFGLGLVAGTRIVSVDGRVVATLREVREALRAADARAGSDGALDVALAVRAPGGEEESLVWRLTAAEREALRRLGWRAPVGGGVFAPMESVLRAGGPWGAVVMGVAETRRVMLMTYVTFLRLFQGSVRVEHLKGPVGIAHMGTIIADRGLVWLVFFLALISVNLAVVNFLPLPIVDGGQFLFLVYEQIRGKPVPMVAQQVATMAGLALIAAMFLVVTYHDVRNLLGL